ncbi:hypothetical protein IEN85_18690 [Pelagicoccus sp. NFK12]|uniref:Uncharacterized protein n=1 Tax=Pelagicoccus enzymogenes TaxID=2773457 RepID=A0A927FD23_9BACT|nr:hypothetical protein [Pelagicoccus enzymogenes]MBD5781536.1 hypothetical protein [Pelagicoccus enzymogenes]
MNKQKLLIATIFCFLTLSIGLSLASRSELKKQQKEIDMIASYAFSKHANELIEDYTKKMYQNIRNNPQLSDLSFQWKIFKYGLSDYLREYEVDYNLTFNREISSKELDQITDMDYNPEWKGNNTIEQTNTPHTITSNGITISETLNSKLITSDPSRVILEYRAGISY